LVQIELRVAKVHEATVHEATGMLFWVWAYPHMGFGILFSELTGGLSSRAVPGLF
jgi:hypothetical protein